MIAKPATIIVASGRSGAIYDYGALIDSFETVVRFQGFEEATGLEAKVGQKVDVCVINGSILALEVAERTLPIPDAPNMTVLWTPSYPVPDRQVTLESILARCNYTYETNSFDLINELRDEVGGEKRQYPSSGCVAVAHFLRREPSVAVHGFDMLDPAIKEFVVNHYYDEKVYPVRHNYAGEADFMRAKMAEGRLTTLHDLVARQAV